MRWTRGIASYVAAAGTVAALLGLAGPAEAEYSPQPVTLAWHPAGPVHASVAGNGVVYLGGKLDGTGGIAAVDASTGGLLWMVPTDDDVRALALSADGTTLFAGGRFATVAGVARANLVALDLADHSVIASWKGRAAGTVRDLVAHGSDLYVAGKITTLDGVAQRGIGALDASTGSRDAGFDLSADNDVLGLALSGDRLVLSGSFTHVSGVPRNLLASIDLSTGTLTGWAPNKLCGSCDQYWDVQTDGTNAYVATSGNAGGAFSLSTGKQAWPIIRGTGDFQAAWLPGDGQVYFGGHFGLGVWSGAQQQNVVDAKMLVAVSTANGQIDSAWTPRLYTSYPGVWCFTSTAGKLWVGGAFTGQQVNGSNNHLPYIAAYPAATTVVDNRPPTGTFAVDTTKAWAAFTAVRVTQSALHDNVTPADLIVRSVAWGDGTVTRWTTGTTVSHVFRAAGTYTPQVTLTDQAGNRSAPIATSPVTVTDDNGAPGVTLRLPRHQHSVDAWRVLRGKATDAGTGVSRVSVKAVEKRAGTWYGYDGRSHRWLRAATKAKAFATSKKLTVSVDAQHRWSARLAHLRKGTLVSRVWAVDQVGNRSVTVTHQATLRHR